MSAPPAQLELLLELRAHGPYEDWWARPVTALPLMPDARFVLARRPSAVRDDRATLEARLARAAEVAELVSHYYVLPIYGMFESPDGQVFQVSEVFNGVTLGAFETAAPQMDVAAAVSVARQLLEALAHAHAQGYAHLAVGPSAVWLGREGEVRLDFGLARSDVLPEDHTAALDVRFSHPAWMERDPRHPRLDVYGVCAVLWWLLIGEPFRRSVADQTYYPASSRRDDVPPGLDALLEGGLGVDPGREPPSASALADALDRVALRELNADDQTCRAHIARFVAPQLPELPEVGGEELIAVESIPGVLTQALAARAVPVPPAELTRNDLGVLEPEDLLRDTIAPLRSRIPMATTTPAAPPPSVSWPPPAGEGRRESGPIRVVRLPSTSSGAAHVVADDAREEVEPQEPEAPLPEEPPEPVTSIAPPEARPASQSDVSPPRAHRLPAAPPSPSASSPETADRPSAARGSSRVKATAFAAGYLFAFVFAWLLGQGR